MIIFLLLGPAGDLQRSTSPPHRFRFPEAHELSTEGAVGGDGWTPAEQRYWEVTFIIQTTQNNAGLVFMVMFIECNQMLKDATSCQMSTSSSCLAREFKPS